MKELKLELGKLLDEHKIVECHDSDCEICIRVKRIGKVLYKEDVIRYILTNRDGRVKKFKTKLEVRKFLRVDSRRIDHAIKTCCDLKCWYIEHVEH